jgi:excisionase family DNA binding protein
MATSEALPRLLTVPETATLLRTTPTAVYAMIARARLPGVTRLGRRILVRADVLVHWLDQNHAPSPQE